MIKRVLVLFIPLLILSSCGTPDRTNIAHHDIFSRTPEEVEQIKLLYIPYVGNNCKAYERHIDDNTPQTLTFKDELKDEYVKSLNEGVYYDDRQYKIPDKCYTFLRVDVIFNDETTWGFEIYSMGINKVAFNINDNIYRAIGDYINHFWFKYKDKYDHYYSNWIYQCFQWNPQI